MTKSYLTYADSRGDKPTADLATVAISKQTTNDGLFTATFAVQFADINGWLTTAVYWTHSQTLKFHKAMGDYQICSVLYCVLKLCTVISTLRWAVLIVLCIVFCLTGPITSELGAVGLGPCVAYQLGFCDIVSVFFFVYVCSLCCCDLWACLSEQLNVCRFSSETTIRCWVGMFHTHL